MFNFVEVAYAAQKTGSNSDAAVAALGIWAIILLIWYVVWIVQAIMGYGTAYRKTKANGDNGVSLFGWMIVYCSLAALVPGLGIYLWIKSKEPQQPMPQYGQPQQWQQPVQQYGQPQQWQQPQGQPYQPAQPMQPVQPAQPIQTAQPVQPVQVAQPSEDSQNQNPIQQ